MTAIPNVGPVEQGSAAGGPRDLRDVDLDEFLQLLITEMQNQDPLDPMENAEVLQQIGLIREISATDKLTDTLDSVLTGQNLATASGLIGKHISALSDEGENLAGLVDRVSVEASGEAGSARRLRVHIGQHSIDLANVREIQPGG